MDRERGSLCPSGSHPRAGEPDGDRPAPTIGVGRRRARSGHRWRRTLRRHGDRGRRLGHHRAGRSGARVRRRSRGPHQRSTRRPPPPTSSATSPPLLLDYQTPSVGPGQPTFDLQLKVGGSAASVPASQLGLSVAVYACLSSVSGFDQSVTAGTPSSGELSSHTDAAAPQRAPDHGGRRHRPLDAGGVRVGNRSRSSAPFTIDLAPSDAECRAYPVRRRLSGEGGADEPGGRTVPRWVHHPPHLRRRRRRHPEARASPWRFRSAPPSARRPHPAPRQLLARPSAALDPPSPAAMAGIAGVVTAVDKNRVPVTLEASPQTLAAMDGSATLRQLAALAAPPSVIQFTAPAVHPGQRHQPGVGGAQRRALPAGLPGDRHPLLPGHAHVPACDHRRRRRRSRTLDHR